MRKKILKDNRTFVPAREDFFQRKFRDKYDVAPPIWADLSVVYYEDYTITKEGVKTQVYQKSDYSHAFRFYPNGAVNRFTYSQDHDFSLDSISWDPEFNGSRGVTYLKNGEEYISYFTRVTGSGSYGIFTTSLKHFIAQGDSLTQPDYSGIIVYKKYSLSDAQIYNANW